MVLLRGITWDHRRAVDPLQATLSAFRARHPEIDVRWDKRSLHGFEFASVAELARDYDLIVLDHPFCGEIAEQGCLAPLDSLLPALSPDGFVGPSLASYHYADRLWALPVDAACQAAAGRPDLMAALDAETPRRWSEVLALGERARRRGLRLAIALKGVHGLMTFFTLCASAGRPCGQMPADPFVDRDTGRAALGALRRLLAFCPSEVLDWNSIALHDAMAGRDDLAFCPAVYVYATYAEADNRRPLGFFDLPGLASAEPSGSTVGGTGIGLSSHAREPAAAAAYLAYLAAPETQKAFALHHGQPARKEAWDDREINRRFAGSFAAIRATMDGAWIRPRYCGYLAFQAQGGALVECHLRGDMPGEELLDRLTRLHEAGGREAV